MQKNVAEVIVEQLVRWGVKRVYGVSGDANLYFLHALAKHPDIEFIQARHETAAAFMASAEAKLTGLPGVCTGTTGPGLVNMLNGLADAASDRTPLMAITGQVESSKMGMPVKQYIDQQVMIQPLALWSALLCNAQRAAEMTWIGLHHAHLRGGVAHLSVLKDLWNLPGGEEIKDRPQVQKGMISENEVQLVAELLQGAERPVIMAGRGIAAVASDVKELALRISAPVITSLPAKGLIAEDFPLCVGGLGHAGTEAAGNLLKESDLILLLGTTWWPQDYTPVHAAPIIQVDADKANLALAHPAIRPVNALLEDFVPALLRKMPEMKRKGWLDRIAEERQRWFEQIKTERGNVSSPIMPQALMAALEKIVPPEAIMVLDVGDHVVWYDRCYWGGQKELLISGTWRSMAFGLPAAIAAKLIFPEKPVVCICGDGGLTMTLGELVTASQYQAGVKLVVVNNGSLAMEENRAIVAGLLTDGLKILNPDFVQVAQACGWEAYKVNKYEELEDNLAKWMASARPSLIDVSSAAPMPAHTML